MIRSEIAVLGAGAIGRGWAALAAARGLAVALHDPDARALKWARADIEERVDRLVRLGRADATPAREGLAALRTTQALADAVAQAARVIEAVPEDLAIKWPLLRDAEAGAPDDTLLLSSSSGFRAAQLGSLMRRPGRLVVTHPLHPVELIPVVEVLAGPGTDPIAADQARQFLGRLGQQPILLRRDVPGNAVGRLAAAVWRESIHLVLEGVLDAGDLDRLVANGPALGWAAAGPHLTYHLAGGDAGLEGFLDHLQPTMERWWQALASWTTLDDDQRRRLVAAVAAAYGPRTPELERQRDDRLGAIRRAQG